MPFTLSKTFRFETAHRLALGYEGKCANIHGHSWLATVKVSCNRMDKYSMGMDYAELKSIVKPLIDILDHAIMLQKDDKELIVLCDLQGWEVVQFKYNPTSEMVAVWLYDRINPAIKMIAGSTLLSVMINETCTSECEYNGGLFTVLPIVK